MSYENPYGIGTEVLRSLSYNVDSHGDLSAHYDSLINADLPQYAGKFYFPKEHEQVADVKYKKIEIGYDKNLREITKAFEGAPIEAYIPLVVETSDTGSALPKVRPTDIVIKDPKKEIIEEIIKAQREVAGREIILQELDVEEIIIRRRIRKREIKVKDNKK